MSSYRFYYLNERDHFVDADWAPCPDDEAAAARARTLLLAEARDYRAIEIWNGTRRVDPVALATRSR